jgi:GAF domain-containing protein/regulatory Fis family protein
MKRKFRLIDQFADLVVGADDPWRLAVRTLEMVMSLTNGRSGAVFAREGDRMTLFASRGIDQHVLDAVEGAWTRHREGFLKGETLYIPDRDQDRRLGRTEERGGPASFAVAPVFTGDELVALFYVDSLQPHFCTPHDLERMSKFSRILAKAVSNGAAAEGREPVRAEAWEHYLERTPVDDMAREKLLLLLNRNEWNIARVSRLMGVTRRTIYLRLQRYGIPREKIRKTLRRPAIA